MRISFREQMARVRVKATQYKNQTILKVKEKARERKDLRATEREAYKKQLNREYAKRGRARAREKMKPFKKPVSLGTMNNRAQQFKNRIGRQPDVNPVFILGKSEK